MPNIHVESHFFRNLSTTNTHAHTHTPRTDRITRNHYNARQKKLIERKLMITGNARNHYRDQHIDTTFVCGGMMLQSRFYRRRFVIFWRLAVTSLPAGVTSLVRPASRPNALNSHVFPVTHITIRPSHGSMMFRRTLFYRFSNIWGTRNRKHRRAAAKPAACAKPLMLSTVGSKGQRGGRGR